MTLRLAGSTSGYTEIDAPAVAGSNTLVLPTGNGTSGQALQTNGSGALSWGPGVANDAQLCKAWVNFNGTGTVAIRASYNVSSITDNGVGNYTVNFTNAFANANYAAVLGVSNNTGTGSIIAHTVSSQYTATQLNVVTMLSITGGTQDPDHVCVSIFR
jgi:hypothetical protein